MTVKETEFFYSYFGHNRPLRLFRATLAMSSLQWNWLLWEDLRFASTYRGARGVLTARHLCLDSVCIVAWDTTLKMTGLIKVSLAAEGILLMYRVKKRK
jgi:hypothetical protein